MQDAVPDAEITFTGEEAARPAPGGLEAIAAADWVLLPPSDPVVSVGAILGVAGIAPAIRAKTVVGVSPIIGGAAARGMANACQAATGVEPTAPGGASHDRADR